VLGAIMCVVGPGRYCSPRRRVPFYSGMPVRDSDGFGRGSDSDGFGRIPSSPAGDFFAVLYSLYGHFGPTEMGSGFGRESDSDGFGRIPGPQIWKSATQLLLQTRGFKIRVMTGRAISVRLYSVGLTAAVLCYETATGYGLTPVHYSAQRKRFLWDRGCVSGLFTGC